MAISTINNPDISDEVFTPNLDESSSQSTYKSSSTGLLPRFDRFPDIVYAQASRIAGRVNAAGISDAEHKLLLAERQNLLDKVFAETISSEESNRLEYVRWSLDRIEDAKCGDTLDFLENSVSRYEQFLSDLQLLKRKLQEYELSPKKKK